MPVVAILWMILATSNGAAPAKTDVTPASPATYRKTELEGLIGNLYRAREKSEAWLQYSPDSYLAAIQRVSFKTRAALTVGSDADNDVQILGPGVEPHHLRVSMQADSFRVVAVDDSARFECLGEDVRDTAMGPGTITIGRDSRYTIRLSHQNAPAIIVFDTKSPHFKDFRGRKYFAFDGAYRFLLPLTQAATPDTVRIASTQGTPRLALRMGWFDFLIGKTHCRLAAYHLLEPGIPDGDLAVFFRDATNGKETWPDGRLLSAPWLHRGNRYVLDFNLAENPACAISRYHNCPLPPKENTLKIPILAGEKDMHYIVAKR